jgi:hypothetical protein
MNKDLILIGGGVLGGATSRGIAGVFPATANPKIVHGLLAVGMGFGATKVNGSSTQAQLLKGALIGGAVVKGLDFIKSMVEGTATASKLLASDSKMNQFLKGATGLGCPMDDGGLNAVMMGSDGRYYQYDESGLQGTYIDESGNVHQMDDGLGAGQEMMYLDESGNVVGLGYPSEEEGLYGAQEKDYIY